MKTLAKIILVTAILTTTFAAKAEWVSGHVRNNGIYVQRYYRTPANSTTSYRAYPSQPPGCVSPPADFNGQASPRPKTMPYYGGSIFNSCCPLPRPLPQNPVTTARGF